MQRSCKFSIKGRNFIATELEQSWLFHIITSLRGSLPCSTTCSHSCQPKMPKPVKSDKKKKRSLLILAGPERNPEGQQLKLRSYGLPALPHSTDDEINDLASRRWCGWVVMVISLHNIVLWARMWTSSVCYQQVSLEPHPSRPLPPWRAGNHMQPSCTEIKQMVFKSWLENDLGPHCWLLTEKNP